MKVITSIDDATAAVGSELGVSDWQEIDQKRINDFADATGDHQWIHIDAERAKTESPYGTTIAHGFLTLSMIPAADQGQLPRREREDGHQLRAEQGAIHRRGALWRPDPRPVRARRCDEGRRQHRQHDREEHHRTRRVGQAGRGGRDDRSGAVLSEQLSYPLTVRLRRWGNGNVCSAPLLRSCSRHPNLRAFLGSLNRLRAGRGLDPRRKSNRMAT